VLSTALELAATRHLDAAELHAVHRDNALGMFPRLAAAMTHSSGPAAVRGAR
jgi:hypothetical protein